MGHGAWGCTLGSSSYMCQNYRLVRYSSDNAVCRTSGHSLQFQEHVLARHASHLSSRDTRAAQITRAHTLYGENFASRDTRDSRMAQAFGEDLECAVSSASARRRTKQFLMASKSQKMVTFLQRDAKHREAEGGGVEPADERSKTSRLFACSSSRTCSLAQHSSADDQHGCLTFGTPGRCSLAQAVRPSLSELQRVTPVGAPSASHDVCEELARPLHQEAAADGRIGRVGLGRAAAVGSKRENGGLGCDGDDAGLRMALALQSDGTAGATGGHMKRTGTLRMTRSKRVLKTHAAFEGHVASREVRACWPAEM
jgi:hypothetical protein